MSFITYPQKSHTTISTISHWLYRKTLSEQPEQPAGEDLQGPHWRWLPQSLMLGQHSVWQCGSGVRGSNHRDIWPYSSCTQPPDPLEVMLIFQACSSSLLWILLASQSVQSLSHVQLFATPWTAAHQASLSITKSQSLLKLISIESVMPSNHLILCHPLLLPSIVPSIRVFSKESVLHIRWPKYWSISISPSSEYSGLISFRID